MPPRREKEYSHSKQNNIKEDPSNDSFESDDDNYRKKRDRNNQAVKRSRVKSKLKTQETLARVTQLKNENTALEEKVKTLTKELGFLKELFMAHASNTKSSMFDGLNLEQLLADHSQSSSNE